MKVQIGLADEDSYPHAGTITFIDNRVDANTGTLRIRATLDNPKNGTDGKRFLMLRSLFGGAARDRVGVIEHLFDGVKAGAKP